MVLKLSMIVMALQLVMLYYVKLLHCFQDKLAVKISIVKEAMSSS